MERNKGIQEKPAETGASSRADLVLKAILVICLWMVLSLINADITPTVSVATLAAVFGPGALQASLDHISRRD